MCCPASGSFPPYEVVQVRRGWTRRHGWSVPFYDEYAASQSYEFTLLAPGGEFWQGQATTGVRRQDARGWIGGGHLTWGISHQIDYLVQIGQDGRDTAWTLSLAEGGSDTTLAGTFSDGATTYRVEGTHHLAGTSMPLVDTAGFLFYDGKRAVAAVDLLNAGAVHLDRSLPSAQRDPLAAAAAALLLYQDISRPPAPPPPPPPRPRDPPGYAPPPPGPAPAPPRGPPPPTRGTPPPRRP